MTDYLIGLHMVRRVSGFVFSETNLTGNNTFY